MTNVRWIQRTIMAVTETKPTKREVFSLETKNDFSDFQTQEMAAAISILCIHIQQKGTMTKDELLKKDDAKETI